MSKIWRDDDDLARIDVMLIFKRAHPVNSLLCVDGLSANGKHVNVFNAHTVRPERVEGWWEVHGTGAFVVT